MPAEADPVRRALADARTLAARGRRTGSARPRPRREDDAWTGAGPDPHDPQPVGAEIERLVGDAGWAPTMPVARLMGAWDTVVGPELAAHCRPERLIDGELALVAESTAWATQVRLLAPQLLARLATDLGADVVRRISVRGPATPDWRHGPRRVTGRGPRDTYG